MEGSRESGLTQIMRRISIISAIALSAVIGTGSAGAASPTPSPTVTPVPVAAVGEVWISELYPNPVGTDTGNEWVELHNRTERSLQIGGMMVARLSGTTLVTVPTGMTLPAGGYLKLATTGSIINGGDTVLLKLGTTEHDRITYDAEGTEGQSWARSSESVGTWTGLPTPDAPNQFAAEEGPGDEVTGAVGTAATGSSSAGMPGTTAAKGQQKSASKLPKSGPGLLAYLILPLAWAGYGYGRHYLQEHANDC